MKQSRIALPIQPVFSLDYFTLKKTTTTRTFHKQFYLSWEDALWHILDFRSIPTGSVILVPEFFCGDVIDNMHAHGLKCAVYPVDKHLKTTSIELKSAIRDLKPALVVVFHAVGITNSLLTTNRGWLDNLPPETILIEDSVHRVLDTEKVRFLHKNHYVIDSLRKVVPVQGSWCYSASPIPKLSLTASISTLPYRLWVTFWWLLLQIFLRLGIFLGMKPAEEAMIRGYDVIGDSRLPSPGSWLMRILSEHLDIVRIKSTKAEQFEWYRTHLSDIFDHPAFYPVPIPASDAGELRGYPLGIEMKHADSFLTYVRSHGLMIRFELNDSPWSTRQKIVYLPMGMNIQQSHMSCIRSILNGYLIASRL